jgi:hypothetical protein
MDYERVEGVCASHLTLLKNEDDETGDMIRSWVNGG